MNGRISYHRVRVARAGRWGHLGWCRGVPKCSTRAIAGITGSQSSRELYRHAWETERDEDAGDGRRTELLYETAMRRLRSDPTVAGKLWQTILEARPDARSKEAIVDVGVPFVSRLIAFQEAINQSLPNSGSASSFEETWAVQEEVEQEVHRWRQEIGQVLVESMPSFPQANSPGKIDESERALDQFIAFANEYERAILLLVGTMSASRADPLLEQLLAMESSLAAILRARASNVQTNAKAYERELTSDESLPVEPVEQQASDRTTEGRCERWLVELDDVTARLFSLGH